MGYDRMSHNLQECESISPLVKELSKDELNSSKELVVANNSDSKLCYLWNDNKDQTPFLATTFQPFVDNGLQVINVGSITMDKNDK